MTEIKYSISKEVFKERQRPAIVAVVCTWIIGTVLIILGPKLWGWFGVVVTVAIAVLLSTILYLALFRKYRQGMDIELNNEGVCIQYGQKKEKHVWSEFDHLTTYERMAKLNAPVKASYGVTPVMTGVSSGIYSMATKAVIKGHGVMFLLRWANTNLKMSPYLSLYTNPDNVDVVEAFLKEHIIESGKGVIKEHI
ncbi:MAG: hypothetical protein PHY34_02475 [Patescibacteria group bacterium]|nr:hypothetical protein [Patescibacteria group bacterium]MDD5715197.1 hypothetical protein [Patescibacteria group bacterium]